jgi:hypothetical protein
MSQFDAFGDIINRSDGIFGGNESNIAGQDGGLRAHDSVKTTPTPVGVAVEMQCRGCPRPLQLMVEYPELVAVKYNVPPQEIFRANPNLLQQGITQWKWSQNEQAWWPEVRCSGCGNIAGPMFTPEEAEVLLGRARRNNWINEQGESYISNLAYQRVQAMSQGQGRR